MQQSVAEPVKVSNSKGDSNSGESRRKEIEGYEMIIGRSSDSKQARTQWADAVDKILENESFDRAQQHLRTNFENAAVHNEKPFNKP